VRYFTLRGGNCPQVSAVLPTHERLRLRPGHRRRAPSRAAAAFWGAAAVTHHRAFTQSRISPTLLRTPSKIGLACGVVVGATKRDVAEALHCRGVVGENVRFEAYKRRAPQQKARRHRFAITNRWLSESSDTGATDVPDQCDTVVLGRASVQLQIGNGKGPPSGSILARQQNEVVGEV
jgi:hypothetical protein